MVSLIRTISEPRNEIFGVRWNSDDSLIACACSDGGVRTYSTITWNIHKFLTLGQALSMPVTCICWRPESDSSEHKNVLITTTSDGWVAHWIASSASIIHSFQVEGELALTCDYNTAGTHFALGKGDFSVDIYDSNTMAPSCSFDFARGDKPGHSNRIFAVKWINENTLVTGGWDNSLLVWDTRHQWPVNTFYGPHLCGQGIDVKGDLIMAGSYDRVEQVQFFSLTAGNKVNSLHLGTEEQPSMVYAAQFSKNADHFLAVGHRLHVWKHPELQEIHQAALTGEVYCCDWAHTDNSFVVGTSDGLISILNLNA